METGEGNHVDGELAQIRVELSRELCEDTSMSVVNRDETENTTHTQAGGDTRHNDRDELVEITVLGSAELEGPEADIVQSLVVNAEGLIRVLNELMNRQGGVVRLDDGVGHFGRGDDGEGGHHAIGELLADFGNEQCSHTGSSSSSERVQELESLEEITSLSLDSEDVCQG